MSLYIADKLSGAVTKYYIPNKIKEAIETISEGYKDFEVSSGYTVVAIPKDFKVLSQEEYNNLYSKASALEEIRRGIEEYKQDVYYDMDEDFSEYAAAKYCSEIVYNALDKIKERE